MDWRCCHEIHRNTWPTKVKGKDLIQANFGGMYTEALIKHSLKTSPKKFKKDYIDALYFH